MNLFDRAVGYFFPEYGLRRMRARWAMAHSFEMTRPGRNKRPRSDLGGGGDDHLDEMTLWEMREISQSLNRNNGLAANVIDQNVLNVIGPSGFGLNATTADKILNADIEAAWEDWTQEYADPSGDGHFWTLLSQVWSSRLIDGDHFLQFDPAGQGCVRCIESARVTTPISGKTPVETADNLRVYHGIARNTDKRPVWYFVSHEMPQEQNVVLDDGQWYPADNIIPVYAPERYSQTRGRPMLATASRDLDDLDDLFLAIRVGAKLACSQVWWLKTDDPQMPIPGNPQATADGQYNINVEPGSTIRTNPGQELQLLESKQPATQLQEFMRTLQSLAGLAGGLPYELATLDFSRSTLGTNRVALQLAYRGFARQQFELTFVIRKIYRFWMKLRIKDRTFPDQPDVLRHQWTPPSWSSPFPLDDARADDIRISNGTDSRTNVARKNGLDIDRIRDDQEREKDWAPIVRDAAAKMASIPPTHAAAVAGGAA